MDLIDATPAQKGYIWKELEAVEGTILGWHFAHAYFESTSLLRLR
jgi:hypothetical protein